MAQVYKKLEFALTDDDDVAFSKYHIMQSEAGKKAVVFQRLTFVFLGFMFWLPFLLFGNNERIRMYVGIGCAVFALIGAIFARKMVLHSNEKAIRRNAYNLDKIHPRTNYVTITYDTIIIEQEENKREIPLNAISIVDENDDGIFIWAGTKEAIQIPAHTFRSTKDKEATYQWLKDKVGK